MGAPVDYKYDQMIDTYIQRKEIKKLKQEVEEFNQHQMARMAIVKNRRQYESINGKTNFGNL